MNTKYTKFVRDNLTENKKESLIKLLRKDDETLTDIYKRHTNRGEISLYFLQNLTFENIDIEKVKENLAIRENDIDNTKKILIDYMNRDFNWKMKSVFFCIICEFGFTQLVVSYLTHPLISPEVKDNYAIRLASQNGHTEVVKLLIADKRVSPEAKDNNYTIRFASKNGHLEVVPPEAKGNYAIKMASENGHLEVVKLLLADERVSTEADNNYAIRFASQNGHLEVVKLLLDDKRVSPEANDNYAIRFASQNGHLEVVKLLLNDERASPEAKDNYAIIFASQNGHLEIVKLLLDDKRALAASPEAQDNFAIRLASENGHTGVVKLLLADKRVSPEAKDNFAIRMACRNGHLEIVKLLLDHINNKRFENDLLKFRKITILSQF